MEAKNQSKVAKVTLKSSLKQAVPEPTGKSQKRTRMQFEAEKVQKDSKPDKKLKPDTIKPKWVPPPKPMKTRSKSAKEKGLKPLQAKAPGNKIVKFANESDDKAHTADPKLQSQLDPKNADTKKARSRSATSSVPNNASQSTAGTLPVELQP